jgi:membrane protease YdiL (CAAX protease family)
METIPSIPTLCPFCSSPVQITDFFCPTCGKNIREKPPSTTIGTQIKLYLVSILLPPLFIGWTIKYLKAKESKARQMGIISLGLIIIVLVIGFLFSLSLMKTLSQQVNQQINQYQDVGL